MNKKSIALGLLVGAVIIAGTAAMIVSVQAGTVTVSATVATSVSCSTATTTTAFGTLTTGVITTSTPNVTTTMSCNYGAGCTLSVNDAGDTTNPGLWNSVASHLVPSADATLSAGVEGYGIQGAGTAAGTGGTLTIATKYLQTGNVVGGLSVSTVTLASSAAPISGKEVVVTHKAAISGLTSAGSYADTITYGCTGN
ncbi:MAG: hypothetical protein WC246_00640 [Candidatus Paceibacterota bacterium]|jgi:hypothetical protein